MTVNTTEERLELTGVDKTGPAIQSAEQGLARLRTGVDALKGALGAIGITLGVGTLIQIGRQTIQSATEAEQAGARITAVMRATGNTAGITKQQLDSMAEALSKSTQFDDDGIRNAQANLLKFGNIHGKVFGDALKLSTDLAAFMGTAVPEASQLIGKSLQSPLEGLASLEKQFGKLTEAEEAHIQKLLQQGNVVGAQNAVLDLWRQKIGGVAEEMNTGLTKATTDVDKAWNDLLKTLGQTEAVGGTTLRILQSIARTLNDIAAIAKQDPLAGFTRNLTLIDQEIERLERGRPAKGRSPLLDERLDELKREREALRGILEAANSSAVDPFAFDPKSLNIRAGGKSGDKPKTWREENREWLAEQERMSRAVAEGQEEEAQVQHDASEALKRQAMELEKERQKGIDETTKAWVQSAQIMDDASQDMVYTWNEFGEQVIMTREQFELLAEQQKDAADATYEYWLAISKASEKQADEARRQWERTSDAIENALANSIIRGGKNGLEYLKDALRTAILMPIIQPIVRPVAQAMTGMVQGVMGGGFGGLGDILTPGGGIGGGMLPGGGGGLLSVLPYAPAALQLMRGNYRGAGLGAAGAFLGNMINPGLGGLIGGALGSMLGGGGDGDAERTSRYVAGLGEGGYAYQDNRWFSGDMWGGQSAFDARRIAGEQNLMRNLGLSGAQVSAINQQLGGLGGKRYGFGMEHTDVTKSGAFEAIMADRLQAISSVLGRSIEELTSIMSMSAEQWQDAIDAMERALEDAERNLRSFVKSVPDVLGITGLESFQKSLAVSDAVAPLDRLGAARSQYDEMLSKALGGDLNAARAFPDVAQQLLGIGRDTFASGGGFQDLFREVNTSLSQVLDKQRDLQADILSGVEMTMQELSQNEIAELRAMKFALVEAMNDVKTELQRMQAA